MSKGSAAPTGFYFSDCLGGPEATNLQCRSADINGLVEEGLNLAYHGARAEKQGFNIKLEKSFDPNAGEADVSHKTLRGFLLNLISNGFYAATKRSAETNVRDYEPTLEATTKNRGDCVEITIRDNGTGIPADVKERMFNPFFTTKPAGEGTGLGLSISHDIVVKQHGGSIEVNTDCSAASGSFHLDRTCLFSDVKRTLHPQGKGHVFIPRGLAERRQYSGSTV